MATGAVMELLFSSNSCCGTKELRNMGTGSLVPVSPGITMRGRPSALPMCHLRQLPIFAAVKANPILNLVNIG